MIDLDAPIVPNRSAAGLEVGAPVASLLAAVTPRQSKKLYVVTRHDFPSVSVWENERQEIEQIGLKKGYRGLINGVVGVGSPLADVEEHLGRITKDEDGNRVVDGLAGWCFDVRKAALSVICVYSIDDPEIEVYPEAPFELAEVLVSGDPAAVEAYISADNALIADWKGEPELLASAANDFLPDALEFEYSARFRCRVTFRGKTRCTSRPKSKVQSTEVIDVINEVIHPYFELRAFRCTLKDDTVAYYLKPASWWKRVDAQSSEVIAEVFEKL